MIHGQVNGVRSSSSVCVYNNKDRCRAGQKPEISKEWDDVQKGKSVRSRVVSGGKENPPHGEVSTCS